MLFQIHVACPCGFKTQDAIWGPTSILAQNRVGIPVYLPRSGELLTHWFDSDDLQINPEDLDLWIQTHGRQAIQSQYGPDAAMLGPPSGDSPILECPRCHRTDARPIMP